MPAEQDKRWVTIRPPGAPDHATTILLARASSDRQARYIGDQAGGRVFLFLAIDDFARDHAAFTAAGVEWVRPPAEYEYGRVAVFSDLYGNLWDLVQFACGHPAAPYDPEHCGSARPQPPYRRRALAYCNVGFRLLHTGG